MANVPRVALGFTSDAKGHFVGNFSATFTIGGVQYNQNFMAPTWVRAGYTTEDMWIRHHFGMMDINFWANVAVITWFILVEDMGKKHSSFSLLSFFLACSYFFSLLYIHRHILDHQGYCNDTKQTMGCRLHGWTSRPCHKSSNV